VRRNSLALVVREMEEKRVIEIVRNLDPEVCNRISLVPEAGNRWRPVIYLSTLNSHILCPTLKMETLGSVQKGQWTSSLDRKDAYFHIPIPLDSRRYLRFLHQGVIWQFRALPFGLSTAPRIITHTTPTLTFEV
jgi:hypothetical protein